MREFKPKQILGKNQVILTNVNMINKFTTSMIVTCQRQEMYGDIFSVVDDKDLFIIIFTKHKHVTKDRNSRTCLERDSR